LETSALSDLFQNDQLGLRRQVVGGQTREINAGIDDAALIVSPVPGQGLAARLLGAGAQIPDPTAGRVENIAFDPGRPA
jgi:hypothetical protein